MSPATEIILLFLGHGLFQFSDLAANVSIIEIDELVLHFRQGIQPCFSEIILKNSTID